MIYKCCKEDCEMDIIGNPNGTCYKCEIAQLEKENKELLAKVERLESENEKLIDKIFKMQYTPSEQKAILNLRRKASEE